MLRETLKKLMSEFRLNEDEAAEKAADNANFEKDIVDKLDRSVKFDEVDTITFGLETDDGKIIKVYVNAEQAEGFEKALSQKLGEVDDIEEVLNELSKEFEIVDVEWPTEGDSSEDPDLEADDGSSALDPKVYKKKQTVEDNPDQAFESLNFGEEASLALLESSNSIESRFTSASQLMVYHAIVDLGVPEIALARNPYRAAIIKGIKNVAEEAQHSASMKVALKAFIRRAVDYEKKAEENEKNHEHTHDHAALRQDEKEKHHKKDEDKEVKEGTVDMKITIAEEKCEWTFTAQKDDITIACNAMKFTLNSEETEKMVKGVTNRDAVVCRDSEDTSKKIVFSPRGSSVMVKQVGTQDGYMMSSKDLDDLLSTIAPDKKPEDDSDVNEEQVNEGQVYKGYTISGKPFHPDGPRYTIKQTGSQVEEDGYYVSVDAAKKAIDKKASK